MHEVFQEHLARLIDTVTVAGIKVLAEMVAAEQITSEEKRALQYQFCRGMGSAHFVMSDPKQAAKLAKPSEIKRHERAQTEPQDFDAGACEHASAECPEDCLECEHYPA